MGAKDEGRGTCAAANLTPRTDSLLDGTPTLRLNEFVLASLAQGKIALEVAETPSTTPILVEEIKFVTDERINDGIHKAVDEFAQVMGTHELQVRRALSGS